MYSFVTISWTEWNMFIIIIIVIGNFLALYLLFLNSIYLPVKPKRADMMSQPVPVSFLYNYSTRSIIFF